jgi:predicted amidohydrolase
VRIAAAAAHFSRDLGQNLRLITRIVTNARRIGTHLLVLPDGALGGYLADMRQPEEQAGALADDMALPPALEADDPRLRKVVAMAADMVICFGYTESNGGNRYNSAICVHGDGVLGRQRKVHQPPAERATYAAGGCFRAFDTPVGRLGMLVDYDKTFPEAARVLALDGAHVIASPSAWPTSVTKRADRIPQDRQTKLFDLYDRARAAENQLVFVSANQTGILGDLRFLGQSKIVGPGGEVLGRTGAKPGLAVADVDVEAELDRARRVLDHLAERIPAAYCTEPHAVRLEQ